MSEFDAYNEETEQWETHPISRLAAIKRDKRYSSIVCNEEEI